jgi:replicative DNA helicase
MPNYGEQLLSKVIDENDVNALTRFGIDRDHLGTKVERAAYDYIKRYAAENGGAAPSYVTITQEVAGFTYMPAVTDSFEFISRKIADNAGKRRLAAFLEGEVASLFESNDAETFISALHERLEEIRIGTIGTNVRNFGKTFDILRTEFRAEYEKRKAGQSFKLWRTPFPSLNETIGGLYSGDIYGIMAESGRGKTYLAEVIVDELLRQGAKVLVKSYEVKAYPWLARLFSIVTAREEAMTHEDMAVKVGLPNKAILSGQLEGEVETYFLGMVDEINRYYPGTLVLQAKSDKELTRTLADLDRELSAQKFDAIVIDPIYGLADVQSGRNANRTAGGAAEWAVREFERIIGEHDVVGIYTIQAQTERQETDDDGRREIRLPKRDQVKTTKAALEIATNLFTFDAVNGNGRIGIEKGRNGGEGFTIDLIALMDYGVLRELPSGAEVASQFNP